MPPHEFPPATMRSRSTLPLYSLPAFAASATIQSIKPFWSAMVVDDEPPPDVSERTTQPPPAHLSNNGLKT
jgi:hypothetical protein